MFDASERTGRVELAPVRVQLVRELLTQELSGSGSAVVRPEDLAHRYPPAPAALLVLDRFLNVT